jgi:hypothetical protein
VAAEQGAGRAVPVRGGSGSDVDLPPMAAVIASLGHLMLHSPDEQVRRRAAEAIIDLNLDARRRGGSLSSFRARALQAPAGISRDVQGPERGAEAAQGPQEGRPGGGRPRRGAAFHACCLIYATMAARSVPVRRAPPALRPLVPTGAVAVFVGNLVPLVTRELGMTSSQTYHARKVELLAMGCVAQLRQGKRQRLGAWALLAPPTVERWDANGGRPFSRRVEHEHRQRHAWYIEMAGLDEGQLAKLADQGEAWLREHPEVPCLGFHGGPHVCGVGDLDVLAPSRSAGAWKRRADHAAKLAQAD